MDEINLDELKKKLQTFKEYKTYIYVVTKTINYYNGYVLSVHYDAFMFFDDDIPKPFPIRFDELKYIPVPSKKERKKDD